MYPLQRTHSLKRNDGIAARSDRIYISKHYSQFVRRSEINDCNFSDHDYIRLYSKENNYEGKSADLRLRMSFLEDNIL